MERVTRCFRKNDIRGDCTEMEGGDEWDVERKMKEWGASLHEIHGKGSLTYVLTIKALSTRYARLSSFDHRLHKVVVLGERDFARRGASTSEKRACKSNES